MKRNRMTDRAVARLVLRALERLCREVFSMSDNRAEVLRDFWAMPGAVAAVAKAERSLGRRGA